MAMSTQEAKAQLGALAREIEGHERAIAHNEEKIEAATARGDEKEARRLETLNDKFRRTIRVAKEQTQLITGTARTRSGRGQKRG